jgi:hypothetical protein
VTIVAIARRELVPDVLDDRMDLRLGDPGTLHPHRLGRTHRQEQRVALTDELLGAGLVEDDPRVGRDEVANAIRTGRWP